MTRFPHKFLAMVLVLATLNACGAPLTTRNARDTNVSFSATVMDAPLQCLGQLLWKQNKPPLNRQALQHFDIRVGKIPDQSGKSNGGAPSDNPARLQTYFQAAIAETGLFSLTSVDDGGGLGGDLPILGTGHAPTDFPSLFLVQGALNGDTDLRNSNLDAVLSIGPAQLLLSHRRRFVAQSLYVEFVGSFDGRVVSAIVDDPYTGTRRRMHMTVATTILVPETAYNGALVYTKSSGDTGSGGGGAQANINRPAALSLAAKAITFEMLRRIGNSYKASERCLTPEARQLVTFPRQLKGVIVAGTPKSAASTKPAKTSTAPTSTARTNPASVSTAQLTPFDRLLSPGMRAELGGQTNLVRNAALRHLESAEVGQVSSFGSNGQQVELTAGPVTNLNGRFCRVLNVFVGSVGATSMTACREKDRAVWRFVSGAQA